MATKVDIAVSSSGTVHTAGVILSASSIELYQQSWSMLLHQLTGEGTSASSEVVNDLPSWDEILAVVPK